eukprot:scaffold9673_cov142-Skeletonema_menzelii.AAC.6
MEYSAETVAQRESEKQQHGEVAQIMSSKEESESGMGQQSSDAVAQDVKVNLRLEECAKRMEQCANYAASLDAQIKLKLEECASGMERSANYAAFKDARIKLKMEEYADVMEQAKVEIVCVRRGENS